MNTETVLLRIGGDTEFPGAAVSPSLIKTDQFTYSDVWAVIAWARRAEEKLLFSCRDEILALILPKCTEVWCNQKSSHLFYFCSFYIHL